MGWMILLGIFYISILVHELGHALVIRRYGMRISEFCLGFPSIFTHTWRGTKLKIGVLPLIGYVSKNEKDFALLSQRERKQMAISVGGPAMTLLLSLITFISAALLGGDVGKLYIASSDEGGSFGTYASMAHDLEQTYRVYGLKGILQIAALLNMALLLINLLPIPLTDGGKILFAWLEGKFGTRFQPIRAKLNVVGAFILLISTVLVFGWEALNLIQSH